MTEFTFTHYYINTRLIVLFIGKYYIMKGSIIALIASTIGSVTGSELSSTCDSLSQRKNFTSLSNEEKSAWIEAEKCLTTHDAVFGLFDGATTLWDEQQYLHLTMSNYIHAVVRNGDLIVGRRNVDK